MDPPPCGSILASTLALSACARRCNDRFIPRNPASRQRRGASLSAGSRQAMMARPASRPGEEVLARYGKEDDRGMVPSTVDRKLTASADRRLRLQGLDLSLTLDGQTHQVNVEEEISYPGESWCPQDGRHRPSWPGAGSKSRRPPQRPRRCFDASAGSCAGRQANAQGRYVRAWCNGSGTKRGRSRLPKRIGDGSPMRCSRP